MFVKNRKGPPVAAPYEVNKGTNNAVGEGCYVATLSHFWIKGIINYDERNSWRHYLEFPAQGRGGNHTR